MMRRGLAGLLLALLTAVLTAPGAAAHDALVSTTPEDGASGAAPRAVVLRFVRDVLPTGTFVEVVGPNGHVTDAAPERSRSTVTQALSPGLAPGRYRVTWRAVSGDGHPVTGTFGFTVVTAGARTPAASATAAPSPTPAAPAAPAPSFSEAVDDLGSGEKFALAIGALAAVAGAVAVLIRRMRDQGGG